MEGACYEWSLIEGGGHLKTLGYLAVSLEIPCQHGMGDV